ncbi:MAG: nitrite reductase [Deltaproteobacteria bacterium]|nr:nitrite reductase [Deltaproteobacteria bacterium]
MAQAVNERETKAQRLERLKRAKNPWECFDEIARFAREGYETIPEEWLKTYFRWWGVYTQGDGAGVVAGKGGEGNAVPFFMVRIRLPNGLLQAHQLRTIAALAACYGRGVADLTVRQNIQLHWVAIEALPDLFHQLWRCGLTTLGSCGDDTRNITGCPLAGVDADEICDASPLVLQIQRLLVGNPAYYNLPRKYKICITGCRVWCSYPEINDIGLTALPVERDGEARFSVRVGGGLSTEPHLGLKLDGVARWSQATAVVRGITEIFRESKSLRENREKARLKYLFLEQGWTAASFQEELEQRMGFPLEPAIPEEPPADIYRDHVGVHRQKQDGLFYVGVAVLRGRITAEQLHAVADLAARYGSGELRTTNMQNLLILNVPARRVDRLVRELESAGLRVGASSFWRGTIACTGSEFCKLALTETKGYARWVVEELERRLPGFSQQVKLHITGCPNSCGQHWIADIGLQGVRVKTGGQMVDGYYFCVGGAVGRHQAVARKVGYRTPATGVPAAVERLLRRYLEHRHDGENFRAFCARHTDAELRAWLAGGEVEGIPAPEPSGRLPHGIEG